MIVLTKQIYLVFLLLFVPNDVAIYFVTIQILMVMMRREDYDIDLFVPNDVAIYFMIVVIRWSNRGAQTQLKTRRLDSVAEWLFSRIYLIMIYLYMLNWEYFSK